MEIDSYAEALCEPIETKANKLGFTLGDDKEFLEALKYCVLMCWISELVTDSQMDAMMKKLQKKVEKALKPLEQEE